MREFDVQQLLARRKEHLVMNMFAQPNNNDYVDTNRPEMLLREFDVQQLLARRKEHLVMNMFAQPNNNDYVDTNRPEMLLRNHNGTKF